MPLSFAAAGCVGLMPIVLPGMCKLAEPGVAIACILYAISAICGISGAIAAVLLKGETIALFAILSAFGTFGFAAEIVVLVYSAFVPTIRAHRWH